MPDITMGDSSLSEETMLNWLKRALNHTERSGAANAWRPLHVTEAGDLAPAEEIAVSHPSPVITIDSLHLTNLRSSSDRTRIVGDLQLSGLVEDAASQLIPGGEGTIGSLHVFLNGDSKEVKRIPLHETKRGEAPSLLKPFELSSTFRCVLEELSLQRGTNVFAFTAVNAFGFAGYVHAAIDVKVYPPPGDEAEMVDHTGYRFEAGGAGLLDQSKGGDFWPFVIGVEHSRGIQSYVVESGGRNRRLLVQGKHLLLASSAAEGCNRPAVLMAMPDYNDQQSGPDSGDTGRSFFQGFVTGLCHARARVYEGTSPVGTVMLDVKEHGRLDDQRRLGAPSGGGLFCLTGRWDSAERLAAIVQRLIGGDREMFHRLALCEVEAFRRLGEEYCLAGNYMLELIRGTAREVSPGTEYDVGWWTGRVLAEVLLAVVPPVQGDRKPQKGDTLQKLARRPLSLQG